MKVVVTGNGQLAWELERTAPSDVSVHKLTRADVDLTDAEKLLETLEAIQPDVIINAAAYTAVDKAESDQEMAYAVNRDAVQSLAKYCQSAGAYFLHVSTDFVFDGSNNTPYSPDSPKKPLGVYGESKSAGEDAIAETMGNSNWAIIRTAWVYSSHGNNFVKTMLRLMGDKPQLGVIGDQIGTPTWAKGLAEACWAAAKEKVQGIFHWTDAGVASWYDFAVAIQRLGVETGKLEKAIPVNCITTADYPTPAARPHYSVLDKAKILEALPLTSVHWQQQLAEMMAEVE